MTDFIFRRVVRRESVGGDVFVVIEDDAGRQMRVREIPRCPDCGSLYCAKGGGLESLIGCLGRRGGIG